MIELIKKNVLLVTIIGNVVGGMIMFYVLPLLPDISTISKYFWQAYMIVFGFIIPILHIRLLMTNKDIIVDKPFVLNIVISVSFILFWVLFSMIDKLTDVVFLLFNNVNQVL
ncbi:hypothetical protein ACFSKN_04610 [Mariniflexile gromovii]|uniref:Uncharacterized protein n=1 Tax=Mariniflexile gromovii TaxID=362523 RepID=A0ABS4BXX7_9FLAO|nr:hypothetical protein [Mariniflexile gromovii]MBP0904871.1 hypothetical protein [Mariniflexile gromovii]